jgi:uncharacterized protein YoxC
MNSSSFIIAPLTGSTFRVWTSGLEYDQSTTLSVPIANDNTLHFVYFDTSGNISVGVAEWDITGNAAPCAMVYRTGTSYAIFDERHSATRNRAWHEWSHDTIGCRYANGFAVNCSNAVFSVAVGALHDEDIEIDTSSVISDCRLWYRNGGGATNTFESGVTAPYKVSGGGNPQYDNVGTLTSVGNNYYFNSWIYGTNDQDYPIFIVAGQDDYSNLSGARNEGLPTIQVSTREWKLLYRLTFRQVGGAGTYIEATDYRVVSSGPGSSYTPQSHLNLTDIGEVTHPSIDVALTSLTAAVGDISSSVADLTASVSTLWEGIASTSTTVRASASTFTSMTASTLWESLANLTGRVTEISHSVTGLWASVDNQVSSVAALTSRVTSISNMVMTNPVNLDSLSIASRLYSPSISAEFHRGSSSSISVHRGTSISASTGWMVSLILSGALDAASVSSDLFIGSSASISAVRATSVTMSTGGFTSLTGDFFYAASASIDEYNWTGVGGIATASVQDIVSGSTTVLWSALNTISVWIPSAGISVFSSATNRSESLAISVHTDMTTSVAAATTRITNLSQSIPTLRASVTALEDRVISLSTTLPNLWTTVANLSQSVSNYQSAMLTSISTNAIFVSSKLSLGTDASITYDNYVKFLTSTGTPLIISTDQINIYTPVYGICTSVNLNNCGMVASSVSISVIRGISASISADLRASVGFYNSVTATYGYFGHLTASTYAWTGGSGAATISIHSGENLLGGGTTDADLSLDVTASLSTTFARFASVSVSENLFADSVSANYGYFGHLTASSYAWTGGALSVSATAHYLQLSAGLCFTSATTESKISCEAQTNWYVDGSLNIVYSTIGIGYTKGAYFSSLGLSVQSSGSIRGSLDSGPFNWGGPGAFGSISGTTDIGLIVQNNYSVATNTYGLFVKPRFTPSVASSADIYGIAGYAYVNNQNKLAGARAVGLEFGPYAYCISAGETAFMSAIGVHAFGCANVAASFCASDVVGLLVDTFYGLFQGDAICNSAYGIVVQNPSWYLGSVSVSVYTGIKVQHTTTIGLNDYQVQLDGSGRGQGIFFNVSNSNNFARVYQSSSNNLVFKVAGTAGASSLSLASTTCQIIAMSQSALCFFDKATPKAPTTSYVSTGFTSLRSWVSLSQSCDSTASMNIYVRQVASFIGTMAEQMTSLGLFRSA